MKIYAYNTGEVIQYFTKLFDCTAVDSKRSLVNHLVDYTEKANALLFIDFTYMRSSGLIVNELWKLLLCSSPCIIIALSSGGGYDIEETQIASIMDVRLTKFRSIGFQPFNHAGAKAFVTMIMADRTCVSSTADESNKPIR